MMALPVAKFGIFDSVNILGSWNVRLDLVRLLRQHEFRSQARTIERCLLDAALERAHMSDFQLRDWTFATERIFVERNTYCGTVMVTSANRQFVLYQTEAFIGKPLGRHAKSISNLLNFFGTAVGFLVCMHRTKDWDRDYVKEFVFNAMDEALPILCNGSSDKINRSIVGCLSSSSGDTSPDQNLNFVLPEYDLEWPQQKRVPSSPISLYSATKFVAHLRNVQVALLIKLDTHEASQAFTGRLRDAGLFQGFLPTEKFDNMSLAQIQTLLQEMLGTTSGSEAATSPKVFREFAERIKTTIGCQRAVELLSRFGVNHALECYAVGLGAALGNTLDRRAEMYRFVVHMLALQLRRKEYLQQLNGWARTRKQGWWAALKKCHSLEKKNILGFTAAAHVVRQKVGCWADQLNTEVGVPICLPGCFELVDASSFKHLVGGSNQRASDIFDCLVRDKRLEKVLTVGPNFKPWTRDFFQTFDRDLPGASSTDANEWAKAIATAALLGQNLAADGVLPPALLSVCSTLTEKQYLIEGYIVSTRKYAHPSCTSGWSESKLEDLRFLLDSRG